MGCTSVIQVTAAIGSALTAGHQWELVCRIAAPLRWHQLGVPGVPRCLHRRQASSHNLNLHSSGRYQPALDLACDLDLRRPVKHAGRNSAWIWGVNRQGCRFSRPAPWMARGGGPPNPCRITGTPSVSEVPSVGARAFCLLLRFSKVSRRKGGTHISRYPNNGYIPNPTQPPNSTYIQFSPPQPPANSPHR